MKVEGEVITLSSGRELSPNCGIVGINPDLEVFQGYDGPLSTDWNWEADEFIKLTDAERRELADYMIGLWTQYRGSDADAPAPTEPPPGRRALLVALRDWMGT